MKFRLSLLVFGLFGITAWFASATIAQDPSRLAISVLGTHVSAVEPVFTSGVISDETEGHAVAIDVDIRDAKRLFLVVTDAGDGITCDFANWANARLVTADGEIDLRELKWQQTQVSWGKVRIDRNAEDGPMRIAGRKVRGIGTHANSLISYQLPDGVLRFKALAGLDTQGTDEGLGSTVRFLVYTKKPEFHVDRADALNTKEDSGSVRKFGTEGFSKAGLDKTGRATPAESFRITEGFRAELVYTVPLESEGSWVSLAVDPRGRLLASDQVSGLYRITLPTIDRSLKRPRVERLDVSIGGAQGLLFAFGSLYAVVNGRGTGLYRLRDTDGDDQFDQQQLLCEFDGVGEHGPHAVVLGPRGESLYLVGGNGCFPAKAPERSRVPRGWQEDRLLTRTSASDGTWGRNRNGGWVCKTDRDAKRLELVAMGLRNPYDIAFNTDGELFTFDADMEWDVGTPWYRPTRVNHVVSGADFGWRAGTSKWPDWYFDSVGSVVDVGLSSPTGMTFGYQAQFPEKYRQALFMGDWSLGNIFVTYLKPKGATYVAECESFLAGAPLPVTDLVINPLDGALYFVVGGRGINSALYRVSYVGEPGSLGERGATAVDRHAAALRKQRHEIERFHDTRHRADPKDLWPLLASQDRAIRYAARVALEQVPVDRWQDQLVELNDTRAQIAGVMAAVRHVDSAAVGTLLDALDQLDWEQLDHSDQIDLLRTYQVLLSRHGRDGDGAAAIRDRVSKRLDPWFPSPSQYLLADHLLAEILVFVQAPRIVDRLLDRLENATAQESQIHYAMCLRDARHDWTLARRRRLFAWFQRAAEQRGGVLFGDYIWQIRRVFEAQLNDSQRAQLADVLALPEPADPLASLSSRPLVKKWDVDGLLKVVDAAEHSGDAEHGVDVYKTALCLNCHRVDGQGGMIGPDLTSVTRRFNARDLVEAMVTPDKVISEQFQSVEILTEEGKIVNGKITDINGNVLVLMNDPLNPADLTMVKRDSIDEMSWSSTSLMPTGLLDTFSAQDVIDLIAFLHAAAPVDP